MQVKIRITEPVAPDDFVVQDILRVKNDAYAEIQDSTARALAATYDEVFLQALSRGEEVYFDDILEDISHCITRTENENKYDSFQLAVLTTWAVSKTPYDIL